MTVLGIETATAVAAVGIVRGGRVVGERCEMAPGAHACRLSDLVRETLAQAGLGLADVEALAVSVGPGSFTGLRIGIGFAKGVAFAGGQRLVAVPTLEALADVAPEQASWVATCLDARKGEVYFSLFRRNADGLQRVMPEAAAVPEAAVEEIARRIDGRGGVVVGDAAEAHPEAFARLSSAGLPSLPFAEFHPRGSTVARSGAARLLGGTADPASLAPRYLYDRPSPPRPGDLRGGESRAGVR